MVDGGWLYPGEIKIVLENYFDTFVVKIFFKVLRCCYTEFDELGLDRDEELVR